jgi:hypothetical protein
MAENGKSGNPANAAKKEVTPTSYVLYTLGEDKNLTFVTTATATSRDNAVQEAVRSDSALAGTPLVAIAESRLVQVKGSAKTTVAVEVV